MNDKTKEYSAQDLAAKMQHIKELKEKLESLKLVTEAVNSDTAKKPVQDRLKNLANPARPDETRDQSQAPKKDKNKKPMGLGELAKKQKDWDKKAEKAGIDGHDGDKKSPEEKKSQQKAKVLSTIKLPSNMEIHEQADKWVLVSKTTPEQRTDITDVMNAVARYNSNVEAVNSANAIAGAVQGSIDGKAQEADKKAEGLTVNANSGNVVLIGEALKDVKDVNGAPVFKPEDVEKVAQVALDAAAIGNIKDPKLLEEINNRKKKNDKNAEEKKNLMAMNMMKNQQVTH